MKASIPRTATFSWSPSSLSAAEPYIASGTVAGALDESFSNDSVLEIWQPFSNPTAPVATTTTSAKLNRLAWGYVHPTYPKGLLAGGLENGQLAVWNADKIISGASDSQILKNTTHTGPVRGLDFNANQANLLASGAVNAEIYIWDLTNPTKPYSPGAKSQKLDEITSLQWNGQVPHILATSSSSGYTVVWDLKNKREVCALAYGGGAGTALGGPSANGALAAGGRRGMGAVAWHPDVSTRLVTASEDDSSPIIMLWDLRNARAPEKILTGHDKGVLSLSWCKQDSDLLVSCGKDNRTLVWNPQTTEIIGEMPSSSNWSFDVQWCPRNPSLLATASFDGQIGIHSLQATNQREEEAAAPAAPPADGSDIFNLPSAAPTSSKQTTVRQPPKWLKRPISATFGFGGQLVSVANLAGKTGTNQSSVVHLREVVTEPSIVSRAKRLQEALDSQSLADFCSERSQQAGAEDAANWKALQTLFRADSRDELVALLGFSKEDVVAKVNRAISAYKTGGPSALAGLSSGPGTPSARRASSTTSEAGETNHAHEPVVSFAQGSDGPTETTASEVETAASSEAKTTTDGVSSTEPSLFSDDNANAPAGVEFFNTISGESGAGVRSAVPERVLVPHSSFPPASSVAATAGSPGPSSVASADLRASTFRIYPSDESDADKLITRALVLGDFESAVSLCISTDRFADALLLAVRGGPELLARTQKTYFERRTTSLPYLRLFQSIVSDDLTDVVQNADLNEWQEIFVVLCTFAKADDFSNLAEQLGQRLEFQYVKTAAGAGVGGDRAKAHRKNAILCYLAAGKLEKVAGMWIDEMKEEEAAIRSAHKAGVEIDGSISLYSAHAEALQTFMEKITVFQNAVGYVDSDLQAPTTNQQVAETGARTYKLAALYDRIHEYIELLADQGLIEPALKFVQQTPADYVSSSASSTSNSGTGSLGAHPARQRLLQASSARRGTTSTAQASSSRGAYAAPQAPAAAAPYDAYSAAPAAADLYGAPAAQPQQNNYGGYAPAVPQVPSVPTVSAPAYGNANASQYGAQQYAPAQPMIPAPPTIQESAYAPPMLAQQAAAPAPPPPPPKRADGGWNDIPDLPAPPKRTTSAMGGAVGGANAGKSAPIMSPFPNSPAMTPAPYPGQPQQQPGMAPPPRGATPAQQPPFGRPGSAAPRPPPPPRSGSAAGVRGPPQPGAGMVPAVPSVPTLGGAPRPPPQGQPGPYGPAPGQQPQMQQQPPMQQRQQPPPGPGPYGPAPGQQQHPGPGMQPPPPFGVRPPPPPGAGPPGVVPNRSQTPGAGAGPPRSHTPNPRGPPGAAAFKYPPGDRAHIPEELRNFVSLFSRELGRIKATTPPAQKRMVDDAERRLNLLFDWINNGLVTDARIIGGLRELCAPVERRDVQGALAVHVGLVTAASGEVSQGLVGVKFIISRLAA